MAIVAIAVGGLMFGLSGLCTLTIAASSLIGSLATFNFGGLFWSVVAAMFGGPFVAGGWLLLRWGLAKRSGKVDR